MTRVLVAPDAFKGSLRAVDAAAAMAEGLRGALGAAVEIIAIPLADGGEGTLDALLDAGAGARARAPGAR